MRSIYKPLTALLLFPAVALASALRSPELPEVPWTPSAYQVYLDAKRKEGDSKEAIKRIHPSRLEQMVAEDFGSGSTAGMVLRLPRQLPLPTPSVAGPRVFTSGGYGAYEFYALDLKSLKPTWGVSLDAQGPAKAVAIPGSQGLLVNTLGGLLVYLDQTDGRKLWQRYTGELSTIVPAVDKGIVVTSWPFGNSQRLAAYRLSDGKPLFERQLDGAPITSPLIFGDSVFVSTYAGGFHRFLLAGGHRVYSRTLHTVSAPIVAGDKLLVTVREGGRGRLTLLSINPKDGSSKALFSAGMGKFDFLDAKSMAGKPVSKASMGLDLEAARYPAAPGVKEEQSKAAIGIGGTYAQWAYDGLMPAASGGVAYLSHHDYLSAVSLSSGKLLWRFGPIPTGEGGRFFSRPLVTKTRVYLSTLGGEIIGLDKNSGQARFRWQSGYTLGAQPLYSGGRLISTTNTGELFTLKLGE